MNKLLISALAVALTLTACSDDDDEQKLPVQIPAASAVVLNTGNWGANDASIMRLDLTNFTMTGDLYMAANSEGLGDVSEDIIRYGSKYYATVTESSRLVVLDKDMNKLKTFDLTNGEGVPVKPRYLASANGNVYFTAYDGCITRLDTASLEITGRVAVGDYPEALSYANGKLYANIDGANGIQGTGCTVAVVDESTFTKTKDITVPLNPYTQSITGTDGNVYIVSNGNYAGAPWVDEEDYVYSTVICIDTKTDEPHEVCKGSYIATYKDYLYVLYSEYFMPEQAEAFTLNLKTGEKTALTDLSQFDAINGMDVNPTNGDIYIYDSPYGEYATICGPIKADGSPAHRVAAGYYTCKMLFE